MNFLELAANRYSVRSFLDKEVEKEKLLAVLEAGRLAPSAVNYQPVHYIVVTEQEGRRKISEVYNREWMKAAPAVILVCGNHNTSWKRKDGKDHSDIDVAIAVDHMTLAAVDLGLGTCWVCAFDAKLCSELFALPEHLEPCVLLPIGYPKGVRPEGTRRKQMNELVSWEEYSEFTAE